LEPCNKVDYITGLLSLMLQVTVAPAGDIVL
jgi:hypothetical protein